ncbi:MazG-like family protein [Selenihalanaerobacter shriftii]|uniref:MazG-like family protein n=1 Tax=Selenihalanaerobacter shriftii TaxID=142842 RepID=A0A1T4NNA8_9FIRM|nr:MazG-like family protein [Selenihalanaerobacter shriftii]SJZ80771.1 MazG-like family protein [Selenihalanaerobacter shriftii]
MREYNFKNNKNNITKNLKVIEWLKSELLGSVSHLFKVMLKGNQDKIIGTLANLIISTYLLAKRLGISPERLERKVKDNLRENIDQKHQIEEWYGDLSLLLKHLVKRK